MSCTGAGKRRRWSRFHPDASAVVLVASLASGCGATGDDARQRASEQVAGVLQQRLPEVGEASLGCAADRLAGLDADAIDAELAGDAAGAAGAAGEGATGVAVELAVRTALAHCLDAGELLAWRAARR